MSDESFSGQRAAWVRQGFDVPNGAVGFHGPGRGRAKGLQTGHHFMPRCCAPRRQETTRGILSGPRLLGSGVCGCRRIARACIMSRLSWWLCIGLKRDSDSVSS